jgi:hypothetical protein
MSLWIIKGSDFVDASKPAFEENDKANLEHLMTEFNIANRGVTKRQKRKFINALSNQDIAPKTVSGNGRRPVLKGYRKSPIFIRTKRSKVTLSLLWVFLFMPIMLASSEHGTKFTHPVPAGPALENANFCLFPAEDFRMTTGKCIDWPTSKQALGIFRMN